MAFASTVNLTLTISKGSGGPTANFILSGCSISPTTIPDDGHPHSFTATNSCNVTVTVPQDTAVSVYRFGYDPVSKSGLVTNTTVSFATCASGTCSGRTYAAYYEVTTLSSNYQFSYWNGGGLPLLTNDTRGQQIYEATGSLGLYYPGYEGCGSGNTTTTTNSNAFQGPSGVAETNLLAKYQLPFILQVPMDGYSGSCGGWATSVVNQYSDMLTFNSTKAVCSGSTGAYSCANSWVRVDDMNLAMQTYNDLVAVKNMLLADNPEALQYWHGISVSSVTSDGGTGPTASDGQDTIWHFAKSAWCSHYFGSGNCSTLASEVSDIQAAPSSAAYGYLSSGAFGSLSTTVPSPGGYGDYVDSLYLLGLSYASYNFSQKYDVGHPFVVLPAKPSYSCPTSTSLYPFPYNSTYIESLNLCQYEISANRAGENGGTATPSTVASNIAECRSAPRNGIPGVLTQGYSNVGQAGSATNWRNMFYYEALCGAKVFLSPTYGTAYLNPPYWIPYPSSTTYWSLQPAVSVLLNRMENVGYHQFPKITVSGASSATTNVTLIGGVGVPLLAWFYTNRTSSDTASVSLTTSTYHLGTRWCAVSMLTMAAVSCAGGSTISLSSVSIPAQGWNPIYIFNVTSSSLPEVLYTSSELTATSSNSSALLASLDGPHALGSWLLVHDSQAPARVGNNRTGAIPEYPSLASLNTSLIGENYIGGHWQNYTEQGWYYDSTNHIVYVHYEMGSPVQIIVNNQASGASLGSDGSAWGCGSSTSSYTLNPLTTSSTDDIVVVGTTILSSSVTVGKITDSAGLSWSPRSGQANSGSGSQETDTEEWYAKSASILSLDSVTVTLTGAASACSNAFAVKGANFASPFDPNTGLPLNAVASLTSMSPLVSLTTTTGTNGQITGGENAQKFFHAAGYFLAFYENSAGNSIYYQSCKDTTDCTQPSNWSRSTLFFSGTSLPVSEDFSLFYDYGHNVVYCVVLLGGQTVGWFSGTVSAGVITTNPSNPTQLNVRTFPTIYRQVANSDPQIILDKGGDLIFGVATSGGEADHIEVWKCASASPSCTESNIHILNLGSPSSPPLPTLFSLGNGGIALTYSSGNYNYATHLSYTSCPSGCSGDGSWSVPVATSGNYLPGSCIQDESYVSSDTIYCVADALSTSPTSFLTFTYGGTSWTESTLDPVTAQSEGISTDGNGILVVTYCISASTCYYNASPNSGLTWDGKRTLTTAANAFQSGSMQAAEFMQSSDKYSLDFVSPGGSSSPYSVYFVKVTNYLSTTPTVASVSTSNNADFAFNIFGYYNSTAQTLGTIGGLTASAISLGIGGTAPINAIEYVTVGSALPDSSCSFGTSVYNWAAICDAIQALPGTVITTTSSSQTSSSTTPTSSTSSSTSATTSTSSSRSSSSSSSATSTATSTVTTNSTFLSTSSSRSSSSSSSSTSTSTSSTTSGSPSTGANGKALTSSSTSSASTSKTTTTSQSFGFHITLSSAGGAMLAGGEIQTGVSVVVDFGGPHPVGLSVTGEPAGVSSSFSTVAGTAPFASALVLDSSSSAAPGTYQLTVRGASGTQVASATFVLTVDPAGIAPAATYTETVSSSPSQGGTTDPAAGAYSFESGRLVTITALPFTGWSLDHWLVNGNPAGNGTKFSFVGAGDTTVEAVFSQAPPQTNPVASVSFSATGSSRAQITVDGIQYPLPTSFSWAVGSTHEVSTQTVIPEGSAAEVVLASLQGGVNSSFPEASFTVEKDMTLIASYQTEYLVGFSFTDSAGGSVAAQNATIYGPQGLVTVTSANSSAWLEAGATYTPLGGTVGGVGVPVAPGAASFTVDGPMTVSIPLSTYPVSIKVVDMFGQPISGANVTLTTSGQERLTQITGKNGSATFQNVPMGWFYVTYSYLGVSGPFRAA